MRKDRKWGNAFKLPNGTIEGKGIVSDLVRGKADIITGALLMTPLRIPFLDYLPATNTSFGNLPTCLKS